MTRDEMLAQSKMFSERFGDSHRVPIEETLPISVEKAQELWSLGIPVLVLAKTNKGRDPVVSTWTDPFGDVIRFEWFAWVEK